MESGFKRFFLRKSSKSKSDLFNTPLPENFQQTARYDEHAAGPAPTIGTRPIKPSQRAINRKAFSHLRTKSVGPWEVRQLAHNSSDARPRTAPDTQPPPMNGLEISNSRYRSRASQDETLGRPKGIQVPTKVPGLPKGLAEMGGPKYFDLLQAAVSTSKTKSLVEAKRTSFDLYNESIASRNSRYGEPPVMSKNKGVARHPPTHRDKSAPFTNEVDTQRASFDAMRSSRNAQDPTNHSPVGGTGIDMPQASTAKANNTLPKASLDNAEGQGRLMSESESPEDIVPPLIPSESRRATRKSIRQTDLPAQLAPTLLREPERSVPLLDPSSRLATRKRSKTVPGPSRQGNVPDWRRIEKPVVLTLKPFEAGLDGSAAADSTLDSSISPALSRSHRDIATEDQVSTPQPLALASGYVPSRMSSDRSKRERDKDNSHSHDLVGGPRDENSEAVLSVRSASRKEASPSRKVMDLTVDGPTRKAGDGKQNGYDDGREEPVAPKADPLQVLRASVVSANSYVYKGGDGVTLEKVLNHRPSPSLPKSENDRYSAIPADVQQSTKPDQDDKSSPTVDLHPPTATTTLDTALQSSTLRLDLTSSNPSPSRFPLEPSAADASPEISPREPGFARTSLPFSTHHKTSFSSENILPRAEADEAHYPPLVPAFPKGASDKPPTNNDSTAVLHRYEDIRLPKSIEDRGPPGPAILTRDFAHPQAPSPDNALAVVGESQSTTGHGIYNQKPEKKQSGRRGDLIHIGQEELGNQSSELDRSFAVKKQAAAEALLKLQALMAMPTWDEPSTTERLRELTKMPSYWRNLSIEVGSPVAPSEIFKKVKIPILSPPLSRHSTFSSRTGPSTRENPERLMNGIAEGTSTPHPDAALDKASSNEVHKEDFVSSTAPLASPEQARNKPRSGSDTASSQAKGSHSRIGSTVSAMSGTSAQSVPYHMVPVRSSSMRDSDSSAGDFGESEKVHAGELGWH